MCRYCDEMSEEALDTFSVNVDGVVVVVTNVPCTECLHCGEVYYKDSVMTVLDGMVKKAVASGGKVIVMDYASR